MEVKTPSPYLPATKRQIYSLRLKQVLPIGFGEKTLKNMGVLKKTPSLKYSKWAAVRVTFYAV